MDQAVLIAVLAFSGVIIASLVAVRNRDLDGIEKKLGERDLHIIRLEGRLQECETAREVWLRERVALYERLARVEVKANGGST